MSAASTRLLVLGVARFSQPATGYAIMRELISWEVEGWASVNPGSVYGALRALVKDELMTEEPGGAVDGPLKGRRETTRYRLTDEGDSTFAGLLRSCLWDVVPYDPAPFLAALCFIPELTRAEVVAALEERALRLESQNRQLGYDQQQILSENDTTPPHAVEVVRLTAARLGGELSFTRDLCERVRGGDLYFADEERWMPKANRP